MKFNVNRKINKIQVPIVRNCNRKCPDCCARTELKWYNYNLNKSIEVSLEELKWAGDLFGELEQIEITGGEPTMHSQFEFLTNNLHNFFRCKDIILVSNGWLFERDLSKLPLLLKYNSHYFTHYNETFSKINGGHPNTNAINIVKNFLHENGKPRWEANEMYGHIPQKFPPHPGGACGWNSSNMISYYEKRLYGCCVAWSSENKGKSIPLTNDWRVELNKIELPCESCFLSI